MGPPGFLCFQLNMQIVVLPVIFYAGKKKELGAPIHNFLSGTENVRFTLISFVGFPSILSALQPFQIYIFNSK